VRDVKKVDQPNNAEERRSIAYADRQQEATERLRLATPKCDGGLSSKVEAMRTARRLKTA
jgi:hypothetical protein